MRVTRLTITWPDLTWPDLTWPVPDSPGSAVGDLEFRRHPPGAWFSTDGVLLYNFMLSVVGPLHLSIPESYDRAAWDACDVISGPWSGRVQWELCAASWWKTRCHEVRLLLVGRDIGIIPCEITQKSAILTPTLFDFGENWWTFNTPWPKHVRTILALGDLSGQI